MGVFCSNPWYSVKDVMALPITAIAMLYLLLLFLGFESLPCYWELIHQLRLLNVDVLFFSLSWSFVMVILII